MGSEPSRTICARCHADVPGGDGWRLYDSAAGRSAAFCRLEHVVPWAFNEGEWGGGEPAPDGVPPPEGCSECGARLDDSALVLVRHRGEHRIAERFCSVEHVSAWAKAGGRWAR